VSPLILDEIILWLEIAVVLGLALMVVALIVQRWWRCGLSPVLLTPS
jgi:hypothetical protein